MTSEVNKTLMQLGQRAEQQDPSTLVQTFVDVGPLFTLLSARGHQVIYGRRGTGKTHALRYLVETRKQAGELALYLDLRTIGSAGGLYADESVSIAERSTRLLLDVLEAIHSGLVDFALQDDAPCKPEALPLLDSLADEIASVRVVGTVQIETRDAEAREIEDSSKATGGISQTGPSMKIATGSSRKAVTANEVRSVEAGVREHRVHFGALTRALQRVTAAMGVGHIWVALDEWSAIPIDLQPMLADLLRRAIFPVNGWTVKIGAIELRSRFIVPGEGGNYQGIELGADASANLDLDDYMVFGNDSDKAQAFFQELLFRHVHALLSKIGKGFETSEQFVRGVFTQQRAFNELVRAAEGVSRDAINIVGQAAQRADASLISIEHVRSGARLWYQRDKEPAVPDDARALLNWIVDEVIKNRQARAFLLQQGAEAHHLISRLFDFRVLHILRKGMSTKDEPGVRFNVYGLDYGCYVQLLATHSAPKQFLPGIEELNVDSEDFVQVPMDDYRSIRRAVLDLSAFEKSKTAAS